MGNLLEILNEIVWGIPALIAILGVGIYLSVRTGFAQLRFLPNAIKVFGQRIFQKNSPNSEISPYQAFCTALGATVGTGNIVGVGGAIAIGGPGAIFWMWIAGILGMITKYAEVLLAVHYQNKNARTQITAGPMYIIKNGMNRRFAPLAYVYAFLGVVASFGVGNAVQINAIVGGIRSVMESIGMNLSGLWVWILGICCAVLVCVMLLGGAKRIATIAEQLVPVASVAYIVLCITALVVLRGNIITALRMIMQGAFSPYAVTGGVIGSMLLTIRIGTARGVFTNEAGLGTAGIAHGCAEVEHPAMQGVLGIVEVFLDTIMICTLTALVILASGVPISYGNDLGGILTTAAFTGVLGSWVTIPLVLIIICLALATVIGWGLYGARCTQFLFGDQSWNGFVFFQTLAALAGAVLQAPTIWMWSEVVNGLMMIPNLAALVHRSGVVMLLTTEYEQKIKLERSIRRRQRTNFQLKYFVRCDK